MTDIVLSEIKVIDHRKYQFIYYKSILPCYITIKAMFLNKKDLFFNLSLDKYELYYLNSIIKHIHGLSNCHCKDVPFIKYKTVSIMLQNVMDLDIHEETNTVYEWLLYFSHISYSKTCHIIYTIVANRTIKDLL